ncbi:MAG: hypothetical protein C4327_00025 [Meiothermus sp.]
MTLVQAIETVLREAEGPLYHREITRRIVEKGLWKETESLPDNVLQKLTASVRWAYSPFERVSPGYYALRSRDLGFDLEESLQESAAD